VEKVGGKTYSVVKGLVYASVKGLVYASMTEILYQAKLSKNPSFTFNNGTG
jgi:hypothetical protein